MSSAPSPDVVLDASALAALLADARPAGQWAAASVAGVALAATVPRWRKS